MLVTKKSSITGLVNSMEINITYQELDRIENRRGTKELIQNIVPHLSREHREFLISGITPNCLR